MTTRFYIPAMYFRNIVGSHVIDVDQWKQMVAERPAGVACAELVVDQSNFAEYSSKMQEIYNFCEETGISAPILRISAPDLYLKDDSAVLTGLQTLLSAVGAVFGASMLVQLETLSAWQVYELRNGLLLDPDHIPPGYRYTAYAKYVLDVVARFSAICTECGLQPVIEPRVGHVISNPDSVLRLVGKDGLPFKLVFDVSHMEFQGINTCDAWDVLKAFTAVVHVSDTDVTSAHHANIGSGRVPWRTLLSYAAKHTEVGLLGVEIFQDSSDTAEIKEVYAENVTRVRSLIKKYRLSEYFG